MNRGMRLLVVTVALVAGAATVQHASPVAAADPPTVANTQLVWNDVPIGAGTTRSVYVYNYDAAPQLITSTAAAPSDPRFTVVDGCNGIVLAASPDPGYSCEIVYTFTPDIATGVLATSEVVVNGTPYTVHLGGTGAAALGTIAGTMTLTNFVDIPSESAHPRVYVTALDGSTRYQFTEASGAYSVDVPAGVYCVSFGVGPWEGTFASYPDKRHCGDGITPVTVTPGATTAGIDVAFTFGSISGTVRDPDGMLYPDISVRADIVGGRHQPWDRYTDAAGVYLLPNVLPGTYCVRGWSEDTTDPADGPCRAGSRRTVVGPGENVTGVDFQVAPPAPSGDEPTGAIGGAVTDGAATPQPGRTVVAVPVDEFAWGNSATTAADGTYSLTGLLAGQYCVYVTDDDDGTNPLAGEFYADKPSCATADLVTVGTTTTAGIDFALGTGAMMSGQVRLPGGAPAASAHVYLSRPDTYSTIEVEADASGHYTAVGLSPGEYCVQARDQWGDYPTTAYGGTGTCTGATFVPVGAGATVAGIDVQLVQGGTIEGTVTFPPGYLPGTGSGYLLISTRDLDGEQSGYVNVDLAGRYSTEPLAPGRYCMDVRPPSPSMLIRRTLGSLSPDFCRAGTIEVTDGAATVLDFELELGGSISGWVVSPNGYPDGDPSPRLTPWAGENDRVRPDGSYYVTGVAPGTYCVSMPGFGLWVVGSTYDGYYDCDHGYTPVAVAAGQNTGNVNFRLESAGRVTGTITRTGGNGTDLVELHRLDAPQAVVSGYSNAISATEATYGVNAPPGTYCVLVRPHESSGNANAAHGGTPSCAGAAPVVVPEMGVVADIDIALTPQIFRALPNPMRLADTRPGRPLAQGAAPGTGPLAGGTVLEVQAGGIAGVPADAASVALNVTAAGASAAGHLIVFPCGQAVPTASNVNYTAGQTTPNAVIAKLGTDGKVCIYAHATTDVVVDVAGYFPAADGFVPLAAPARVADTRPGRPVVDGAPAGTGMVAAGSVFEVQVTGLADVPEATAAVALNVTAAGATAAGHLTVFACGQTAPTASNVNYATGQTSPNAVIAKVGTGGKVCIYSHAATHLVVDVAGYFPGGAGLTALAAPARLMDTRTGRPTVDGVHAGEGPIAGQAVREVQVGGRAGLPTGAASVILNVTAAGATAAGHLTVFPCGEPVPTASNVNYAAGQTTPNAVLAKLGTDGKVCIRAHAATDVVVDASGFFPAGDGPLVDEFA